MRRLGVVALVAITGCSAVKTPSPVSHPPVARRGNGTVEEGLASWYGPGFHGKRTANGEIYDQEDLTAAHKTLPLGTMVAVTNLNNDRSIDLRVNDRGPYVDGRIIDLSKGAARELGVLGPGTVPVQVEVLAWGDNKYRKVGRGMMASGLRNDQNYRPSAPRPVEVAAAPPPPIDPPAPTARLIETAPSPIRTVAAEPARPAPVIAMATAPAPGAEFDRDRVVSPQRPASGSRGPTALRVSAPAAPIDRFTIQVATLTDADRAHHLANVLRNQFPTTRVNAVTTGERRTFQVEVGPFAGHSTAREQAARITRLGYPATIAQAE